MIVDDEILAVEYLKALVDWEKYGYKVIGGVTSGKRALDICKKNKVQIVISDIKMPVMDGLELARRLKDWDTQIKIILVSAYKEFEYAKQGIKYGVSNYLLKHELNEMNILEELNEVRKELYKEKNLYKLVREQFVKNLIYDRPQEEEEQVGLLNQFGNRYVMFLLKVDYPFEHGMNAANITNETISYEFHDMQQKYDNATVLHEIVDIQISPNNYIILYGIENTHSELQLKEEVYKKVSVLRERLREQYSNTVSLISTSQIYKNELASSFRKLSNAIRYSIFMGREAFYWVNDLSIGVTDEEIHLEDDINSIFDWNKIKDNDGVIQIKTLFSRVSTAKWNLLQLKQLLKSLSYRMNQQMDQNKLSVPIPNIPCYTVEELCSFYTNLYINIRDRIKQQGLVEYSSLVQSTIFYIYNHYREELTLDSIGCFLNMNGVYLGQVFKKEVGITFLKFLTNYRIEKSKQLLQSGSYNISETAQLVGYKTSQYFSHIFYKMVGMTPQDYKKWGDNRCQERK